MLARRVSETEMAAQQATRRFEEMAKKLGEIGGLASQLGEWIQARVRRLPVFTSRRGTNATAVRFFLEHPQVTP